MRDFFSLPLGEGGKPNKKTHEHAVLTKKEHGG